MNIHNLMEDVVSKEVDKLYKQLKKEHTTWLKCDCENCKLDTVCYVLNRTAPKYTVSERGVLHNALDIGDDSQLKVDITSIALEGIRLINSSQRSSHVQPVDTSKNDKEKKSDSLYYNFPMMIGAVYDGNTFEPLSDVNITLKIDDKIAEMYDATWTNPARTYKSTQGSYSFWTKSMPCKNNKETKIFNLAFEVSAENYAPTTYFVNLPLIPEDEEKSTLDSSYSLKVKDIFLFGKGLGTPMN